MRHQKNRNKLGRPECQRRALMRSLTHALIQKESLRTTLTKAKVLRSYVEKLITKAKQNNLHQIRLVAKDIPERGTLHKLFTQIAPRYQDRPGGYLRIYKLGKRPGDAADMALIQFVE